jgi:hypothetical protein
MVNERKMQIWVGGEGHCIDCGELRRAVADDEGCSIARQ